MSGRDVFDRYKRRVNKQGLNSREQRVQQMKNNYEHYLNEAVNSIYYEDWQDSCINGRLTMIDVNAQNEPTDDKYITTSIDSKLKIGSIIKMEKQGSEGLINKIWLVSRQENLAVHSHRKFKVKPCNLNLKIKDTEGNIVSILCYYENQTMYNIGIKKSETNQINFGDTIVKLYMSAEIGRKYIYRGMRILIMVNGRPVPYESTYLDTSQDGLLIFQASESKLIDEDDIENMVAHNYKENNNLPVNPTELFINGLDPLSVSSEYIVTSETIPYSGELDFKFSIDRPDFAKVEKVDNKTCILTGLKAKEYVVLTAVCGDVKLEKDILIKDVKAVK